MNANDVNVVIDNICNKLGTTVEVVVPEYTRYMIASKAITLIVGIAITLFAAALMQMLIASLKRSITKYKEKYERDDWWDEEWVIMYVIGGIVLIVVGIIGTTRVVKGLGIIPWIVSPQGAFIADIMSRI